MKGAVIADLSLDTRRVQISFYPLCDTVYLEREVSLDGVSDDSEARERITALLSSLPDIERTALRLRLTGEVAEEYLPNLPLLQSLCQGGRGLTLTDDTRATPNIAVLEADIGLKGAFYRRLKDQLASKDNHQAEVARLALRFGLAAMAGAELPTEQEEGRV